MGQTVASSEDKLGRYQLVAALGHGGMGSIYLAVTGGLGDFRKLLVVKELRRDLSSDSRFVEMFFDEAKVAARLNHPNVVQTVEAGQEGDRYFLCMEFLDGQPYSALLSGAAKAPYVSLEVRLKVLCDALAGLQYAHELTEYDGTPLRIVHRDVSPQNIFVTYDGQVKVVDFGIAAAGDTLTSPGVFKGKFGYAAPEQMMGRPVDARTDLFAMGVILWETITLRRFARGTLDQSAVRARLDGGEPRLSQLDINVDPRLAAICDRAMHVNPDERFASAAEFRAELEAYLVAAGYQVDATTVRATMIEKFDTQRKALHQRIDQHLKGWGTADVAHSVSGVQEKPTVIADLSRYVHYTQSELMSGVEPRAAKTAPSSAAKHTLRVLVAGGALAAAVALGAWWARSPEQPSAPSEQQVTTDPSAAPAGQGGQPVGGPGSSSASVAADSTDRVAPEAVVGAEGAEGADKAAGSTVSEASDVASAAAKVGRARPAVPRARKRVRRAAAPATTAAGGSPPHASDLAADQAAKTQVVLGAGANKTTVAGQLDHDKRSKVDGETADSVAEAAEHTAEQSETVKLGDDLSHFGRVVPRRPIDTDL